MGFEKVIMGLIGVALVITFAVLAFSTIKSSQVVDTAVYNTTSQGQDITISMSGLMPVLAVVAACVIIWMVIMFIVSLNKGNGMN